MRETLRQASNRSTQLEAKLASMTRQVKERRELDASEKLLLVADLTELDEVLSKLRVEILIFATVNDEHRDGQDDPPLMGEGRNIVHHLLKKRNWWNNAWLDFVKRWKADPRNGYV